jgi:hypothetical protein
VLDSAGVNNSLRAEFIAELAPLVSGNPAPIFCQQQSKVRPFQNKFWEAAHRLVAEYLSENRLTLTVATASREFPAFPDGHVSSSSSSAHLKELAQVQDEECFSDRVAKQLTSRKPAPEPAPAPTPNPVGESPKKSPAGPRAARKKAVADNDKSAKAPPARRAKGKTPVGKPKGNSATASSGHGDDDSASLNEGD